VQPIKPSAISFYSLARANRFDAEGLVVENGSAILLAKYQDGREAEMFSIPLEPPAPLVRPAQPQWIGRLPGLTEPATGADLSRDRKLLAVCSSTVTRIYRRDNSSWLTWRPHGEARYQSSPIEGVCWDAEDLVLVAEGGGFYRISAQTWRASLRPESTARTIQLKQDSGSRARKTK
jgi:hypothetical protein